MSSSCQRALAQPDVPQYASAEAAAEACPGAAVQCAFKGGVSPTVWVCGTSTEDTVQYVSQAGRAVSHYGQALPPGGGA